MIDWVSCKTWNRIYNFLSVEYPPVTIETRSWLILPWNLLTYFLSPLSHSLSGCSHQVWCGRSSNVCVLQKEQSALSGEQCTCFRIRMRTCMWQSHDNDYSVTCFNHIAIRVSSAVLLNFCEGQGSHTLCRCIRYSCMCNPCVLAHLNVLIR